MKEQEIGYVSKYFGQIKVAAIEITAGKLSVGETIHIKGHTTDMNVPFRSSMSLWTVPIKARVSV